MNSELGSSRRMGPRTMVHLPVQLRLPDDPSLREVELTNMSSGGIAFASEASLVDHSPVEIIIHVPFEISLTQAIEVRLPAEVLRVDSNNGTQKVTGAVQFLTPMN